MGIAYFEQHNTFSSCEENQTFPIEKATRPVFLKSKIWSRPTDSILSSVVMYNMGIAYFEQHNTFSSCEENQTFPIEKATRPVFLKSKIWCRPTDSILSSVVMYNMGIAYFEQHNTFRCCEENQTFPIEKATRPVFLKSKIWSRPTDSILSSVVMYNMGIAYFDDTQV